MFSRKGGALEGKWIGRERRAGADGRRWLSLGVRSPRTDPGLGRVLRIVACRNEYYFGCRIKSRASPFFPSVAQSQEGGLLTRVDVVRCILVLGPRPTA